MDGHTSMLRSLVQNCHGDALESQGKTGDSGDEDMLSRQVSDIVVGLIGCVTTEPLAVIWLALLLSLMGVARSTRYRLMLPQVSDVFDQVVMSCLQFCDILENPECSGFVQ